MATIWDRVINAALRLRRGRSGSGAALEMVPVEDRAVAVVGDENDLGNPPPPPRAANVGRMCQLPSVKRVFIWYMFTISTLTSALWILTRLGIIAKVTEYLPPESKSTWISALKEKRGRQRVLWSAFRYALDGDWTWSGFFQGVVDNWVLEFSIAALVVILARHYSVGQNLKSFWIKFIKTQRCAARAPQAPIPPVVWQGDIALNAPARNRRRRHRAGTARSRSVEPPANNNNAPQPLFEDDLRLDDQEWNEEMNGDEQREVNLNIEEMMGPNSPFHGMTLDQIMQRLDLAYSRVKHPLDVGRINQFALASISKEQADSGLQCTICLVNFEPFDLVKRLDCEHYFHTGCVHRWFETASTCPLCRYDYAPPPPVRAIGWFAGYPGPGN